MTHRPCSLWSWRKEKPSAIIFFKFVLTLSQIAWTFSSASFGAEVPPHNGMVTDTDESKSTTD